MEPSPPSASPSPLANKGSAPMAGSEEPTWLGNHPWVVEARLYACTLGLALGRPGRLVERWLGDQGVLNPLTFVIGTAAGVGFISQASSALVKELGTHPGTSTSVWSTIWDAVAPYIFYVAVALVAHLGARLCGGRRGFSSTLGITLLLGAANVGAIQALFILATTAVRVSNPAEQGTIELSQHGVLLQLGGIIVLLLGSVWFWISLARALRPLHALTRWRAAMIALVLGASAFVVAGYVPLPLPHLALHITRDPTTHRFSFNLDGSMHVPGS